MNAQELAEMEKGAEPPKRPTGALLTEARASGCYPAALSFTDDGLHFLTKMAGHGMSVKGASAMFGVSETWMRAQIKENEAARKAWDMGIAEDEVEYRAERKMLRKINAAVHIHEAKTKYGEVPVERKEVVQEVKHVIATNPVTDGDIDDWRAKFAPKQPAPPKEVN